MKRSILITVVSIMIFSLLSSASTSTSFEKWSEIDIYQVLFGNDIEKYYGIEFYAGIDGAQGCKKIVFKTPRGLKMKAWNNLKLEGYSFSAYPDLMPYWRFNRKYPEGNYWFRFYPMKRFGRQRINIVHVFPPMPAFNYPSQDADGVPKDLIVTWEPLSNIDTLSIGFSCEDEPWQEIYLDVADTSYSFASEPLMPDSVCWMVLEAGLTDLNDNDRSSMRIISFSTGSDGPYTVVRSTDQWQGFYSGYQFLAVHDTGSHRLAHIPGQGDIRWNHNYYPGPPGSGPWGTPEAREDGIYESSIKITLDNIETLGGHQPHITSGSVDLTDGITSLGNLPVGWNYEVIGQGESIILYGKNGYSDITLSVDASVIWEGHIDPVNDPNADNVYLRAGSSVGWSRVTLE